MNLDEQPSNAEQQLAFELDIAAADPLAELERAGFDTSQFFARLKMTDKERIDANQAALDLIEMLRNSAAQ
ncbi:MAG: hypothetical protein SFY81_12100 [Verrucomicrobiota bacterium]|nr:hypothetical protein [Verrucomicrobiota bacterium]